MFFLLLNEPRKVVSDVWLPPLMQPGSNARSYVVGGGALDSLKDAGGTLRAIVKIAYPFFNHKLNTESI